MASTNHRRTQAERSAQTRAALIAATIKVLHRAGYAGATLALIAKAAGVTRGSILHQFGTRAQLMVEVVQHIYDEERQLFSELLPSTPHAGRRLSDWPEVVWEVLHRPSGIAALEILQGSRSDKALVRVLRPIQNAIERDALRRVQAFGGPNASKNMTSTRLIVGAVRGLSVAHGVATAPDEIVQSIRLLGDLIRLAEERDALASTRVAIPRGSKDKVSSG